MARTAGVSQATVSRVLQGSDSVTEETRRRVLRAVTERGYEPNALARAMKTQRTGTIGVVVARITNPYYPEMIEALSAELAEAGQRMVLWTSEGAGDASALEAIRQRMVDGVVFTTVTAESVPLREALRLGAPAVTLNRSVDGIACDQVTSDNEAGARQVVEYLVETGHRRLGFIGGPIGPSTSMERERGFRRAVAEAGLHLDERLCLRGDFSHEDGRSAMRTLLGAERPPTAVFCVNDLTAMGAVDGARSLGRRVPDDVWVVGYDDIAMGSWDGYDLTTVRQPITQMAALAVQMLLRRISEPVVEPRHHRFPSELVIRGSTGNTRRPPAGPDPTGGPGR